MQEIKEKLIQLAEPEYQVFSSRLLPGTTNILGVRLPKLRKIAKQLAKKDWREYVKKAEDEYFEETMLQGMTLGYVVVSNHKEVEELLCYITEYVYKINNWSICDSFCSGLKFVKQYKAMVWNYLQNYFYSEHEYEIRFAVVMTINYYIEESYLQHIFKLFDNILKEAYYARMAVAWAVSMCFVKYPEETMVYLKNNKLDKETYLKSLQKICESLKVDKETKRIIKEMKNIK